MSTTKTLLTLLLTSLVASPAALGEGERPNIVYFFADDLGWAGIKANMTLAEGQGTNMDEARKIITPNIDSIVSGGINFTRAYGNPVCSPSRSCQQTGFHQGHTWTDRNDPDASKAMRTQDPTMGKILDAAGYRNGMYGKWGYGTSASDNNPVINHEQTLPIHHGYHDVLVENNHVRAHSYHMESLWRSFVAHDGTVVTDTSLVANDTLYPGLRYSSSNLYFIDDLYAEAAKDFISTEISIQNSATEPKPFFAQISFQVPHSDDGGSNAYDEVSAVDGWFDDYATVDTTGWSASMESYAAMMTHMDKSIGEVLAILADPDGDPETDDSILENTLIIFASDNGGASNGAPSTFNINGHLDRVKTHVFEGGIRVPLAFRWDGTITPGQSNDRRVCITDMLPTFCDLAGVDTPVGIDGVSFAPLLTGEGTMRDRPWLAYEDHNNGSFDWALIKDHYKLIQESDNDLRLYKLDTDEDESQNRASWNSEQDRVAEMLAIAQAERLNEGDNFANVWPTWIGGEGADINASTSWQEDNPWTFSNKWTYGDTPQSHWNAVVKNTAAADRSAVLNESIDTLGFELAGNSDTGNTQTLSLGTGVSIDGRNEIRLSPHAILDLDGGTLSTTRHLEVRSQATLQGAGSVVGDLENAGTVDITQLADVDVPGNGAELIRNGGFEDGGAVDGGNDYRFNSISDWHTESSIDQSSDAAVDGGTNWGTYRGLIHGTPSGSENIPLIQDTGVPILLGDTYTLSFQHDGKSGWNNGTDQIRVRLFYEAGGLRTDILSTTVTPATDWSQTILPIPAVTDADAVGHSLQLMFIPDQDSENGSTEWASVDQVSLTRNTAPTTITGSHELSVSEDYLESTGATLALTLGASSHSSLETTGTAELAASLELKLEPAFEPANGDTFTVLTASSIAGSFDHTGDQVVADNGQPFDISYGATSVTLIAVGVTTSGVPYDWLEDNNLVAPESPDSAYEAAAAADTDMDGFTATEEHLTGTDPNDSSSRFSAVIAPDTGNDFDLSWPSIEGRSYSVLSSPDLSSPFTHFSGPHTATPPSNSVSIDTSAPTRRFFKVTAEFE